MDKTSDLLNVVGICIRFFTGFKSQKCLIIFGQNFEIPAIVAHVCICSKCSNHIYGDSGVYPEASSSSCQCIQDRANISYL